MRCLEQKKRPHKVPEMFANDLSYGRTEEQAAKLRPFQKNQFLLDSGSLQKMEELSKERRKRVTRSLRLGNDK